LYTIHKYPYPHPAELEMLLPEQGCSSFVCDEEVNLFLFKAGRFAFSRTHADVKLLEEGGCEA
jgi:hypothetical protein